MSSIPGLSSLPGNALREVGCGLCGSPDHDLKFRDAPFSVVICRSCGLTYVTPRLSSETLLADVYDEGYWTSAEAKSRGYSDYRQDAPLYLKTYKRRISVVRRHFPRPGRVLDVGCAAGYFLKVMQEEGWQVTGLEPSDAIRAHAATLVGEENLMAGTLGDVDLEPASFDLITMWDVLEHIPDPVAAVRQARRLVRQEGRFLVETQNVDSRAARFLGRRWQHYKHAEHIYHFNAKTLDEVLRRGGFETLENSPKLGGKYVSMGFIQERAGKVHPLLSTLLSPLGFLRRASVYVNLMDEMIVVARPV